MFDGKIFYGASVFGFKFKIIKKKRNPIPQPC